MAQFNLQREPERYADGQRNGCSLSATARQYPPTDGLATRLPCSVVRRGRPYPPVALRLPGLQALVAVVAVAAMSTAQGLFVRAGQIALLGSGVHLGQKVAQ